MSSNSLVINQKQDSGYFTSVLDYVAPRNPVNKARQFHILPEWVENAAGALAYKSSLRSDNHNPSYELCRHDERPFQDLIRETGEKIAQVSDRKDLPYRFTVIDSKTQNAWCMPGGKIAFYEGLIQALENESRDFGVGTFTLEEKVAAVLSHEIVHAAARHSASRSEFSILASLFLTGIYELIASVFRDEDGKIPAGLPSIIELVLNQLYTLSFSLISSSKSRVHEFEADKYGMVYLKRAGYDPKVMVWLQEFFVSKQIKTDVRIIDWAMSYFSSHPYSDERALANRKTLQQIEAGNLQ